MFACVSCLLCCLVVCLLLLFPFCMYVCMHACMDASIRVRMLTCRIPYIANGGSFNFLAFYIFGLSFKVYTFLGPVVEGERSDVLIGWCVVHTSLAVGVRFRASMSIRTSVGILSQGLGLPPKTCPVKTCCTRHATKPEASSLTGRVRDERDSRLVEDGLQKPQGIQSPVKLIKSPAWKG